MNVMRNIRIEKVTLNIGSGKDQNKLEKAIKVLKSLTGLEPVKTITQKRIAAWGLRAGLPIGCKLTLRKEKANEVLKKMLYARDFTLSDKQIDNNGNLAFGIPEYIDIEGAKYDPEIGVLGLQVCVTLERAGFRVKKRKIGAGKIPSKHRVTKDEAITFMKENFNVKVGEDDL